MTGVVALVFLAIGYQTALFIHAAAVEHIASNRDCPDTVYVYDGALPPDLAGWAADGEAARMDDGNSRGSDGGNSGRSGKDGSSGRFGNGYGKSKTGLRAGEVPRAGREDAEKAVTSSEEGQRGRIIVRKNAPHSPEVMAVRAAHPPRKIQLFRFNPNTASVDDFMRLGFTEKQAVSIRNYRQKGGRFRRKSDFARSYVVSEEMYRRLEDYIDIPAVDLNRADSAALDALPGIGPYFVKKIIAHRKALGGFSYPEQLMDIYHFDQEKFNGLADLVTVGPALPYPIWSLPEDSLCCHPYIGSYAAHGVVVYRQNTPRTEWTVDGLAAAGILRPECVLKLKRCRLAAP